MIGSKIQENSRYLEDIQKFLQAIDSIENEKIKNEALDLLRKLQNEVSNIDASHERLFVSAQGSRTDALASSRKNLITFRKKLEKLLSGLSR